MLPDTDVHLRLLEDRIDTLYRTDGEGRLLSTNEWDARPPPRFHLMRTRQGPIFRCRADLPDGLVDDLRQLCRKETPETAFDRLPALHDRYLDLLSQHEPVEKIWAGPAYAAGDLVLPTAELVRITETNAELLRAHFQDWLPDVPHRQPFFARVLDGQAVSLCCSVRISDTVHCAGVETHPDFRGHGYAVDVVSRWARQVCANGAMPFYSTAWSNAASQRVATRLGLRLVAVDFHVT
ncbi:GNAT family N-acetyltransferase [Ensifer sp. 4252]|uniref:GNAT family N-acetyltransferase n=1 Tax=Ensifer sp. 4252 TaxID=3373915 RepID=UPI003D1CE5A9